MLAVWNRFIAAGELDLVDFPLKLMSRGRFGQSHNGNMGIVIPFLIPHLKAQLKVHSGLLLWLENPLELLGMGAKEALHSALWPNLGIV